MNRGNMKTNATFWLMHVMMFHTLLASAQYEPSVMTSQDQINQWIKRSPSFSIFRDNYFITGVPIDRPVTSSTSDAKFQISFKQRLTNDVMPFNSFLFLSYTQKSFWDIYRSSSPFAETNYNPALGLRKYFIQHRKLKSLAVTFEHESNGRDSIYSRSWNRVMVNYYTELSRRSSLNINAWIPFQYQGDNPELIHYVGFVEVTLLVKSLNQRLALDFTARKGNQLNWNGSWQTQLSYRIRENENQFLSIQWYMGYAESLIHFESFVNMVRIGMIIKPSSPIW